MTTKLDTKAYLEELLGLQPATTTPMVVVDGPDDLPGDWRMDWEERAAVLEFDGGQAREHAEAEAMKEVLAAMRAAGLAITVRW